jgi:hypothetical protein
MKRLEKQVEQMLVRACKEYGIKCIKGSSENNKGFPDRVVFHTKKGVIYYVEVKNEGYYKMTDIQEYWRKIIIESGGLHFTITGEKEMEAFIQTHIRSVKYE